MTTGTDGNDNLTNDRAVYNETVDALAGDDVITVIQPVFSQYYNSPTVSVQGGEGFDTLASAGQVRGVSLTEGGGLVSYRVTNSNNYTVEWTGIERVEITGTVFGSNVSVTTGASVDIIRLTTTFINNVVVQTNAGADEIYFRSSSVGGGGSVSISAGEGNDLIDFSATTGAGPTRLADGGDGDDVLIGASASIGSSGSGDRLFGGAGNDLLDGGGGADTLVGGPGNDTYVVDNMADVVTEAAGEGTDTVRASVGSKTDPAQIYKLPDEVENLLGTAAGGQGVSGNALNNVITMGDGGDLVLLHDGGDDTVIGGGGNDYIYYGAAFTNADRNDGGAGTDTLGLIGSLTVTFDADDLLGIERIAAYSAGDSSGVVASDYSFTMIDANVAAGGHLTVVAQSLLAHERLTFDGSAETDGRFFVRGGRGDDTITGGSGNDTLFGNLGADVLTGGGGNDIFQYTDAAQSTDRALDTILDFSAGDKINLAGIDADTVTTGNNSFSFIGDGAFTNQAGQLRAYQAGRGWIVEGDVNGDNIADLMIYVQTVGGHALGAADFML
jgi:Ca2+-binding RTX toxin-like protein